MRKNGKGAAEAAPLIYSRTHGGGKIAAFGGTGEPPPGGGGIVGAHRQGQKGDKTPNGFLSPS